MHDQPTDLKPDELNRVREALIDAMEHQALQGLLFDGGMPPEFIDGVWTTTPRGCGCAIAAYNTKHQPKPVTNHTNARTAVSAADHLKVDRSWIDHLYEAVGVHYIHRYLPSRYGNQIKELVRELVAYGKELNFVVATQPEDLRAANLATLRIRRRVDPTASGSPTAP